MADRTSVGLIGAGKAGVVLARAFQERGYRVGAVWDPVDAARRRALDVLGDTQLPEVPAEVVAHAEVVLLAVPDDVLASVAADLAAHHADPAGRAAVHVSGRYGAEVLAPLRARGMVTAAMHPAMALAGDVETEVRRIDGARFGVTASAAGLELAGRLVRDIGGEPVEVPEDGRALYHAALAHGSNHLVTLVVQAVRMLHLAGVGDAAAVLGPPLRAALDNALTHGDAGATGPVVRGDVGTIREHLTTLGAAHPAALPAYRAMSLAAADIAFAAGRLARDRHERLRTVLTDPA
ncbi:Rossmann-like and DUF2520 domain-containing protein [Amycolatopsis sp. NPDC006131]|uniref:Rossmann-like and DUF2520 domain-containing protein n=1 Tax=Amycolatopsis sp. NPDC006131 TaxID=3156731 RepID=UPI0033A4360B